MLSIKFAAESDLHSFSEAVAEYQRLWDENGKKIVELFQKHTGLSFKETRINALVIDGVSHTPPLVLRYSYPTDEKLSTMVHELGHRLCDTNLPKVKSNESREIIVHKLIYLFVYDVWLDLKGKQFADAAVECDKSHGPTYIKTLEWALSFKPEERKQRFELAKEGNINAFL